MPPAMNALERAAAAYLKFAFQNPACYQQSSRSAVRNGTVVEA
jgi:hypothetical protein